MQPEIPPLPVDAFQNYFWHHQVLSGWLGRTRASLGSSPWWSCWPVWRRLGSPWSSRCALLYLCKQETSQCFFYIIKGKSQCFYFPYKLNENKIRMSYFQINCHLYKIFTYSVFVSILAIIATIYFPLSWNKIYVPIITRRVEQDATLFNIIKYYQSRHI